MISLASDLFFQFPSKNFLAGSLEVLNISSFLGPFGEVGGCKVFEIFSPRGATNVFEEFWSHIPSLRIHLFLSGCLCGGSVDG